MKTRYKILLAVLALIVITIATEPLTHFYHRIADDLIYNNYHHYLPCSSLPDLAKVEETVSLHRDIVKEIENINPSNIEFLIDSTTCPGKASIVIYYASRQDRSQIDKILPDKSFFGVPLTLINR